ncbi:MAG: GNAT family N-acetyltransferase [Candidatus Rokuibacteriota bacterium]|nr:MAG: GNAT family N-acetyltransferase [Candidatus Rokubacteria bacterium]
MADRRRSSRRLLDRLTAARARHHERHRPSGFGFALADSIDYVDPVRWDAVASGASLFLQRRYLAVLERAGPDNLAPRYALIYRGRVPVAAVVMQVVSVAGTRFMKLDGEGKGLRRALVPAARKVGEALRERVLVCGNLLSWGFHAAAFAPGAAPAELWPAVAEAIYRVRRAERLAGETDFALVKDLTAGEMDAAEALRRFSYRPVESDPNMVLELAPEWRSYDDYLAGLTGKYRNAARKIQKDLAQAGCALGPLKALAVHAERLHRLYLGVVDNAAVRPVTLPAAFFPALAEAMGEDFRCIAVRRDHELVGFISVLKDGDTAVAYYIGFDRASGVGNAAYLGLLHAVIGEAIALGCRRISFGRTALEPKAGLGARPERMWLWARHRNPVMNVLVRRLLRAVPHGEAPERQPFKSATPAPEA